MPGKSWRQWFIAAPITADVFAHLPTRIKTQINQILKQYKKLYILSIAKEMQSIICETKKHGVCFQKGLGSLGVMAVCLMLSSFAFFTLHVDQVRS